MDYQVNAGNIPEKMQTPSTSIIDDSIYLQVWNMINAKEQKSTDAIKGSSTDLLTLLPEPGEPGVRENARGRPAWPAPVDNPAAIKFRMVSVDEVDLSSPIPESIKKWSCCSGINCVLGEDERTVNQQMVTPLSRRFNVGHRHSEPVGEAANYSPGIPRTKYGQDLKSPTYVHSKQLENSQRPFGGLFQTSMAHSNFTPNKQSRLSTAKARELGRRSSATNLWVPTPTQEEKSQLFSNTSVTPGDLNSNFMTDESQQNFANRNNININLTFAMGQYINSKTTEPHPYFDVPELKTPSIRTKQKKPKAEMAIQTDSDSLSDLTAAVSYESSTHPQIGYDVDSTSEFPSVIPSRHNCRGLQETTSDNVVCVPETKTVSLNEYIDFPAVVACTGESIKSLLQTGGYIINNCIIMPDDNFYNESELEEGEGKIGISIMRLLGVPQQLRHSIYNEALHTIQAVQEISTETVSVINHVIDWLCEGDGDGGKKLVNRLRRIASVTTDLQPDSEPWVQFENEFCAFTETVGEVMKQGYEAGKDAAKRCSVTVLERLANSREGPLALPEANTTPAIPDLREGRAQQPSTDDRGESTTSAVQSLSAVTVEQERGYAWHDRQRNDKLKLDEQLAALEAVYQDQQRYPNVGQYSPIHRQYLPKDAFMEASISKSENPMTKSLTATFLSKAQDVVKTLQGTGATPILGESECSSRDECEPLDAALSKKDCNGNRPGLEFLETEIQKLAALTDSYLVEPQNNKEENSEPNCPPPPIPKRISELASQVLESNGQSPSTAPETLDRLNTVVEFKIECKAPIPAQQEEILQSGQNVQDITPTPGLKEQSVTVIPEQKSECRAAPPVPKRIPSKIIQKPTRTPKGSNPDDVKTRRRWRF